MNVSWGEAGLTFADRGDLIGFLVRYFNRELLSKLPITFIWQERKKTGGKNRHEIGSDLFNRHDNFDCI